MLKPTTIRMDEDLKKAASFKLEALGLNFNTFVVMATKQLVAQNRIPFDLSVPSEVPDETWRQMVADEARALGLLDATSK